MFADIISNNSQKNICIHSESLIWAEVCGSGMYIKVKPVLRDHCHERPPFWKTSYSWQKALHFNVPVIEPVTKHHLSWETTFSVTSNRWSFKTDSMVYPYIYLFLWCWNVVQYFTVYRTAGWVQSVYQYTAQVRLLPLHRISQTQSPPHTLQPVSYSVSPSAFPPHIQSPRYGGEWKLNVC